MLRMWGVGREGGYIEDVGPITTYLQDHDFIRSSQGRRMLAKAKGACCKQLELIFR